MVKVDADASPQQWVNRVRQHWQQQFAKVLPDRPDLILVPEACDHPGYLGKAKLREYYEIRQNQIRDLFAKVARENNCYIVYTAYRETDDHTWRNTSVLIDRKGMIVGMYNKNYLPVWEHDPQIDIYPGEMPVKVFYGQDIGVFDCDFGRVALVICFDLNFDELRLRIAKSKPDVILFASMFHGGLMQPNWAYSCRSHLVSAVAGSLSEVYSPVGMRLASNTNYYDYAVAEINLDCRVVHLDYNQKRLDNLKAAYGRKVTISDPGFLGAVLVASEDDKNDVDQMLEEFQIELLDDYLARTRRQRVMPGNIRQ